jgi:hypothetical protein
MKNLSKLLFAFALVWGINAVKAQTSLKDDKAKKATEVSGLVNSKNYVFEANQGNPAQKGTVPADYHKYNVAISKDTLIAYLPGHGTSPVKITTTNFAYNAMEGKKGNWDIVIKPKSGITSDVKELKLNVSPTGHASLYVKTASRGPLSFDGYIKQEEY